MSNLAIAQPASSIEKARAPRPVGTGPRLTSVPMPANSSGDDTPAIASADAAVALVPQRQVTGGAEAQYVVPVALQHQATGPLRVASSPALSVYEPTATTDDAPTRPTFQLSAELEAQLITIIDAPIDGSAATGFARKEQQLGAAFAALSLQQSRELLRRLKVNTLDNPVATADVLRARFATFVVERRNRLLAFLADAPRRAAIARR